jgi:antitoxin MazE
MGRIVNGSIVVKPGIYTLKELIDQVTPENLHREIHTGERIGNEEW